MPVSVSPENEYPGAAAVCRDVYMNEAEAIPTTESLAEGLVVPMPTLPVEAITIRSVPELLRKRRLSEAPEPWALESMKNLASALLRENISNEAVAVGLYISNLGEAEAALVKYAVLAKLTKPSKAAEPSTSRSPEIRRSFEAETEPEWVVSAVPK